MSFTFEAPKAASPLKWLVPGFDFEPSDSYFAFVFFDDMILQPIKNYAPDSVHIAGSTAQCAKDTYTLIDPNPNVEYMWHATNASNPTQYEGTSYTRIGPAMREVRLPVPGITT